MIYGNSNFVGGRPLIYSPRQTFNPLSLYPPLWLDFTDQNALFDATTGGNVVIDNGTIAGIQNKGTITGRFTQSTLNNRPIWDADARNGKGAANLNGTTHSMTGTSIASGLFQNKSQGYIFALVQDTNPSAGSSLHTVFSSTNPTLSARCSLFSRFTGNTICGGGRRLDADTFVSSTIANNSNWNLMEVHANWVSGNIQSYRNGASGPVTNFSSGAGSTSNTASGAVEIGADVSSNFFPGNIMHILAFNTTLTATQIANLRTWLAAQAAVTLA